MKKGKKLNKSIHVKQHLLFPVFLPTSCMQYKISLQCQPSYFTSEQMKEWMGGSKTGDCKADTELLLLPQALSCLVHYYSYQLHSQNNRLSSQLSSRHELLPNQSSWGDLCDSEVMNKGKKTLGKLLQEEVQPMAQGNHSLTEAALFYLAPG